MNKIEAYRKRVTGSGHRIQFDQHQLQRIAREIGIPGFAVVARQGPVPVPRIHKSMAARGTPDPSRQYTFTVSTADVDRSGDTIAVKGWRLGAYKTNPVWIWSHRSMEMPIGFATRTWIDGYRLRSTVQIANSELGDEVKSLIDQGVIRTCSVGFIPLSFSFSTDKNRPPYAIDFENQELCEVSLTNVPANSFALIDGIDPPQSAIQSAKTNGEFAVQRIAAAKRQREISLLKQGIALS